MTALLKGAGTPFDQFVEGKLKLAPAIGGSASIPSTPEQSPPATVVAMPKTDPPAGNHLAGGPSTADAQADRTSGERFDLDARIRETVNVIGGDAEAVADCILGALSEDEYLALATQLVADRVRKITRPPRMRAEGTGRSASSRWESVAASADEIEVFRMLVCPKGAEKHLGDCTREEVDALAAGHIDKARRYRTLARLMGEIGAKVVREMSAEAVAGVFA